MNVPLIVLLCVCGLIALYYIIKKLTNTISVDKYEYLTIITFEWKYGRDIRREMQRKMNGRIDGLRFYQQMAELEDEGLIVGDSPPKEINGQIVHLRKYRKKIGGNRRIPDQKISISSTNTELEPVGV